MSTIVDIRRLKVNVMGETFSMKGEQKWLQHVQRMDTNRLPKQALQYKPKGRRNIGRPRKRWRDQIHLQDPGTEISLTFQEHHDDDKSSKRNHLGGTR